METPKASNSYGMNARATPTSSRPPLMASSMASWPASFRGWLKTGSTAPVTIRMRGARWLHAARNRHGSGL